MKCLGQSSALAKLLLGIARVGCGNSLFDGKILLTAFQCGAKIALGAARIAGLLALNRESALPICLVGLERP